MAIGKQLLVQSEHAGLMRKDALKWHQQCPGIAIANINLKVIENIERGRDIHEAVKAMYCAMLMIYHISKDLLWRSFCLMISSLLCSNTNEFVYVIILLFPINK